MGNGKTYRMDFSMGGKRIEYVKGEIVGDHGVIFIEDIDDYISPKGYRQRRSRFKCPYCGQLFETQTGCVRSGTTTSCGCYRIFTGIWAGRYMIHKDLVGQKFGKLTVMYDTGKTDEKDTVIWHCKCDCGNECDVRTDRLKRGEKKSCGCLVKKRNSKTRLEEQCPQTDQC